MNQSNSIYIDVLKYFTNGTKALFVHETKLKHSTEKKVYLKNLEEFKHRPLDDYNFYRDGFLPDSLSNSTAFVSNESSRKPLRFMEGVLTYGTVETTLITTILLCIIIGTIIGNILICIAVILVKKLRRPYNYLIVSLAVSDLCVATLVMPMATIYELLGQWPFGSTLCNIWVSIDVLSCSASILNLCMISVDRYYAITQPLEYGVKRTPKRMISCVVLVWFCAACVSLPPLLILGNESDENQCIVCQNFGYQIYATIGAFYLPLTVMVVVYSKIFRAAKKIVLDERKAQFHMDLPTYLGAKAPKRNSIDVNVTNVSSRRTSSTNGAVKSSTTMKLCFPSGQRNSNESQMPILKHNGESAIFTKDERSPSAFSTDSIETNHNFSRKQYGSSFAKFRIKTSFTNLKSRSLTGLNFIHSFNSTHHKKLRFHLAKERKASMTLGIIMSAFIFCWLPFFVLALIRPFVPNNSIPVSLSSVFLWLGYANSLLNPIIYATLNKDFRKPFKQILFFRCYNINLIMREDFYHDHFGEPDHHFTNSIKAPNEVDEIDFRTIDGNNIDKSKASESFL